MISLRVFLIRIGSLVRARRLDDRLDQELQSHLDFAIEDYTSRGMSPEEARATALRSVGGMLRTRETWRETRGFPFLTSIAQDLRYAARSYRKTPAFTIVALLSLTLAIGANTAIFSLVNALVLRELPVRDPATLVQLSTSTPVSSYEAGVTFPMFERLARRTDVFAAVIGWLGNGVMNISTPSEQTHGAIWVVSGNFFCELGVRPFAGRAIEPDDIDAATLRPAAVAVVGHTFWERHYGADVSAIGQRVNVGGQSFTIVGIAPRGFTALGWAIEPDVIVALTAFPLLTDTPIESLRRGTSFWVRTTGRLKPGVTVEQARAALDAAWPALKEATVPADYSGPQRARFLATRLAVASARTGVEPGLRTRFAQPLMIVFAIAGLILLIACVNLASLLLSRAAARSHEIGVRLAIGASRARIVRQMLVEGLLLSVVGAGCGVAFAYSISRAIITLIFHEYLVAASLDVAPDARVLLFTAATASVASLLFTLVPALKTTGRSPFDRLQTGTRTFSGVGRSGKALVGVQIALSLVLLINAGLLVRTLMQIRAIPSGMRTADVFVAFPGPVPGGYSAIDNTVYYRDVLGRLKSIAGVSGAAAALSKPAGGGDIGGGEPVISTDSAADAAGVRSRWVSVSPGFFDVVGVGVINGRDFAWSDDGRAQRVAVVSETLARRLFPGASAIGRHVRFGVLPRRQDLEIVGVVSDARVYTLKDENVATLYAPALQEPDASWKCFVIRGRGVSLGEISRAVAGLGRERIGSMQSLDEITDGVLLQERLTAGLATFFGALALLLAALASTG